MQNYTPQDIEDKWNATILRIKGLGLNVDESNQMQMAFIELVCGRLEVFPFSSVKAQSGKYERTKWIRDFPKEMHRQERFSLEFFIKGVSIEDKWITVKEFMENEFLFKRLTSMPEVIATIEKAQLESVVRQAQEPIIKKVRQL